MTERVCAVVVTFNRKALLEQCIAALQAQTRSVELILVVDNASTDGTVAMLREDPAYAAVEVLALEQNVGGAGGFHAGMQWAYQHDFDWLWLMDDDAEPLPNCLGQLFAHAPRTADGQLRKGVLVPLQQNTLGGLYGAGSWQRRFVDVTQGLAARNQPQTGPFVFAFVGPLVAREVIDHVGLPRHDFFIWCDDWEYALRIQRTPELPITVVPTARIKHDWGEQLRHVQVFNKTVIRAARPAWKLYYGARNHLYTITRNQRGWRDVLVYFEIQAWHLLGDLAFEPDRWLRAKMRLMGIRDGMFGRMGKRV